MKHSRGYINIDFTGLLIFFVVIGVIIGMVVSVVAPWLWGFIKPLIHALTA